MITVKSTDDIRIEIIGQGAVTVPAETVLVWRNRIRVLEESLREVKEYAEGHHSQEEACVWLHSLTVDIPHQIENALRR